jgi:hypothetical protein
MNKTANEDWQDNQQVSLCIKGLNLHGGTNFSLEYNVWCTAGRRAPSTFLAFSCWWAFCLNEAAAYSSRLSGQENVLKLHVPLNEQSAKLTISIKHRAKCFNTIDAVCRDSCCPSYNSLIFNPKKW